jgi:peptidoglycan hydrolase-like protein with peptidoglycan-binding domain
MSSIRRGDEGAAVKLLQGVLAKLNYEITEIDGVFGRETLDAVKSFQADHGLNNDGVAGVDTVTAMINALWNQGGEA